MNEIDTGFIKASQILPLIHILSVIFLLCAQICVFLIARIFINLSSKSQADAKDVKFAEILRYMKRYEQFFALFLVIVCVSGFFLADGGGFKFSDPMVKGAIATLWAGAGFILLNFIYMHYKILSLKRALDAGDELEANEHLIIVVKYFIPLNIVVTLICVYLGVTVGEF